MLLRRGVNTAGALRIDVLSMLLLTASAIIGVFVRPHPLTVLVVVFIGAVGAGPRLCTGRPWSPADAITAARLGIITICTAAMIFQPGLSWTAVTLAASALLLDAGDGFVARRTVVTAAGEAFDERVDALFVLILSVSLVPLWGPWTMLPGLYYYGFKAITSLRARWQQKLPHSRVRKIVAAAQGILLVTAGSPLAQAHTWLGCTAAGIALTALTWSFARDIIWLERGASRPALSDATKIRTP